MSSCVDAGRDAAPARGAGARACPRPGRRARQPTGRGVGREDPEALAHERDARQAEHVRRRPSGPRPSPCAPSRLARGAPAGPARRTSRTSAAGKIRSAASSHSWWAPSVPCASWCRRGTVPTSRSMSTSPTGDAGDLVGRARAEHGQGQQAGPLGGRQPGDDLLPEELPRGARGRRQDQPHQRRPPGQAVARGLILAERVRRAPSTSASVNASASPSTSTTWPAARRRASGIGSGSTTGEHEVRMRRQPRRQVADELLAGRRRRELVQVVDDDADVDGGGGAATRRGRRSMLLPPRDGRPRAPDRIADDKRPASSSPGSQATQASMPRGAASLARMACASAVVLPNPAPATTTVTGTSKRAASASTQTRPDELVAQR